VLGSFTFILHTHLPYVLHHGKWPHGSDWLNEAAAECYIPILETLDRLDREGLQPRISMDFSPVNLEQLSDPAFTKVFLDYCDEKIVAARKDFAYFENNHEKHLQPQAIYWEEFYSKTEELFREKYACDIVGAFRKLADKGILDAMTCGATHGYFPLLLRDANIRAQIRCAIATHEKYFGKKPRGIWLPECGYRPRYNWSPPVGPEEYRRQHEERAGIEELLAEAGLEYFVVDGALTKGGLTVPAYAPMAKQLHEKFVKEVGGESAFAPDPNRSLAEIYWVKSTPRELPGPAPAVFSRDPRSASRVWAADLGYPGAGVYLDFHKKHHNSGLRYWAVTGSRVDLGDKVDYNHSYPEWQLDIDSDDFIRLVRTELIEHLAQRWHPGIIAAPFDTELFGHWWFEGPRFLEKVMRKMRESDDIDLTDCAQALDRYTAPHTTIALPEGSWGEGGHHYVWTNDAVVWMWDTIYPMEDRFLRVLHSLKEKLDESDLLRSIMEQAGRELLLLEASDWEFVISTQGAIEYSKERFAEHAEFLSRLLDMAEQYDPEIGLADDEAELLQTALVKDRPFESVDLNWWSEPIKF
jgi:1,4-alpha-glucan branching enzyme